MDENEVRSVWRFADAVSFDVDSTVCVNEGIDELAAFLNVGDQVAQLTKEAMSGGMTFQASLGKRLEILQPSRQHITRFIAENPPQLTNGIRELVDLLQDRNVAVHLISGGFQSIIEPVAEQLGVPKENIHANRLVFYYDGEFAGFDKEVPTSKSGGKSRVIDRLRATHGYKKFVHVGDGATDLEAYPSANAVIGFGGNQIRQSVKENSKWFVTSFEELIDELQSVRDE